MNGQPRRKVELNGILHLVREQDGPYLQTFCKLLAKGKMVTIHGTVNCRRCISVYKTLYHTVAVMDKYPTTYTAGIRVVKIRESRRLLKDR